MAIIQPRAHEEYRDGQLVTSRTVQVNVTAEAVTYDLHVKARAALTANAAFLALANPTNTQIVAELRRAARQRNTIIRLLIAADLLDDTAVDT